MFFRVNDNNVVRHISSNKILLKGAFSHDLNKSNHINKFSCTNEIYFLIHILNSNSLCYFRRWESFTRHLYFHKEFSPSISFFTTRWLAETRFSEKILHSMWKANRVGVYWCARDEIYGNHNFVTFISNIFFSFFFFINRQNANSLLLLRKWNLSI